MVELDQFRYRISGYDKPMAQIKNSLDLDNKQKRIEELEADMESPGFWDNPDKCNERA
jgi:peptide chain release factor 2